MVDGQQMDDGAWLYYKLTNEPKGSGELKIMHKYVSISCSKTLSFVAFLF